MYSNTNRADVFLLTLFSILENGKLSFLENFRHLALFGLSSGNGSRLQSTPSTAAGRPGREAFLPGHR